MDTIHTIPISYHFMDFPLVIKHIANCRKQPCLGGKSSKYTPAIFNCYI